MKGISFIPVHRQGSLVAADMLGGEGQQGDMACTLDSDGQPALVLGASASLSTRLDLAPVSDVPPQYVYLLVADRVRLETDTLGTALRDSTPTAPTAPPGRATSPLLGRRGSSL